MILMKKVPYKTRDDDPFITMIFLKNNEDTQDNPDEIEKIPSDKPAFPEVIVDGLSLTTMGQYEILESHHDRRQEKGAGARNGYEKIFDVKK